jgi:hypothetical protein
MRRPWLGGYEFEGNVSRLAAMSDLPSVWIEPTQIRVLLNGEPLPADPQYIIARRGFWKAWKYWRFRPHRAMRAWRDRSTQFIEFRFPVPSGATVLVTRTPTEAGNPAEPAAT